MNRVSLALVVGIGAASFTLSSPQARGQTSPPATGTPGAAVTPTETSTPTTLPAPSDLLKLMYASQQTRESAHYAEVDKYSAPKSMKETDTIHGDISWKDKLLRQYTTERTTYIKKKGNTTQVVRTQLFIVGDTAALRAGKEAWRCLGVPQPTDSSTDPTGSADLTSALLSNASFTDTNLGPETMKGLPVWHIRETMTIPGATPDGKPGIGDYYLAQDDYRAIRQTTALTILFVDPASASGRRTPMTESSTEDFTKYGEHFTVQLPKACRSKQSGAATSHFNAQRRAFWSHALARALQRFASKNP